MTQQVRYRTDTWIRRFSTLPDILLQLLPNPVHIVFARIGTDILQTPWHLLSLYLACLPNRGRLPRKRNECLSIQG
jgi:hypothetical protein